MIPPPVASPKTGRITIYGWSTRSATRLPGTGGTGMLNTGSGVIVTRWEGHGRRHAWSGAGEPGAPPGKTAS